MNKNYEYFVTMDEDNIRFFEMREASKIIGV